MKAWVARDRSGETVIFYGNKPIKMKDYWQPLDMFHRWTQPLPQGINPQWSDIEPTEIELKIERV